MGPDRGPALANSMLPPGSPPWRSIVSSLILQTLTVVGIVTLSYTFSRRVDTPSRSFAITYVRTGFAPPRVRSVRPTITAAALRVIRRDSGTAIPEAPKSHTFQSPLAAPVARKFAVFQILATPELADDKASLPVPGSTTLAATLAPKRPREDVRTGAFDREASAADSGNGLAGRSPVKASGLGDGNNEDGPRNGSGRSVRKASFDPSIVPSQVKPRGFPSPSAIAPVQIKFKPRPVYTDEARRRHIEGDVVLEVVFQASGQLAVKSVVSGLGYGLDEAAKEAADGIQFVPARRDGQAIDTSARIRIVFELAS